MKGLLGAIGTMLAILIGCGTASPSGSPVVTSTNVSERDVVVLVKGWQLNELAKILRDFERKYELDSGTLRAVDAKDGTSRIMLVQPLSADRVLYLINYLHYPEGFDLAKRSPVALAVAHLVPAFGVTTPPLLGGTAAFYVPENDTNYDEVYAHVDNGSAFRVSFTDLSWKAVGESRQSNAVAALQKTVPNF